MTKLDGGSGTTLIQIQIKPWLARQQSLYTTLLTGEILRETEKAVLFSGSASTAPSANCHNCGREIENPISILVGYGPVCSDKLGIPREFATDPESLEKLRREVAERTQWRGWIPKSQIKEVRPA
jgi:hypothetical protein